MAVQADPDISVLFPVGLEERIVEGMGVNAGLPLLVDLAVTGATGLGSQAVDPRWGRLVGDRPGLNGPETENHRGPHLGIKEKDKDRSPRHAFQTERPSSSHTGRPT